MPAPADIYSGAPVADVPADLMVTRMPSSLTRTRIARWAACLAAAALVTAPSRAADGQAADVERFAYDAASDLDVRLTPIEEPPGARVYDVSYASPKGGRVTALLVTPRESPPSRRFAGVLFGHWGGGDRSEFLPEAILYARAGVVSLLPAYPWTRPAPWRNALRYFEDPPHDLDVQIQAIVDLRRGFDLLIARPDVDRARLGYVGHSFGAQFGAILTAVDRRMKAAVLAAGTPTMAAIWLEGDDPDLVAFRSKEPQLVEKRISTLAPLDAIRFVGRAAPIPLLFQFARYDQNIPKAAAERYYEAASSPKEIRWYPTAHDLNDPQAVADRAAWLGRRLGFGRVNLPASR